jgi:anti-sigma factor RsiW
MDCNELVEVITDYLEGTLAQTDRDRFDAHLRECPYCVTYVEQMRATLGALGHIPAESIDENSKGKLLSVFRDWKSTR